MIDQLLQIVPPPAHPVGAATDADWTRADTLLGRPYPADFKEVNRRNGTGWFDRQVWVLGPARQDDAYDLLSYSAPIDYAAKLLGSLSSERIVPAAWTRGGSEFYLLLDGVRYESAVVDLRGGVAERYPLPISELLAQILGRKLRSAALPENFPSDSPAFHMS